MRGSWLPSIWKPYWTVCMPSLRRCRKFSVAPFSPLLWPMRSQGSWRMPNHRSQWLSWVKCVRASTLINALIGEDLAITGVTETTATVNWLKHGTAEQARTFRVVWRNDLAQEPEVRDRSELKGWQGPSELAKRTRYLEFFSEAKFLKRIQIVDTPGTRSVIEDHEKTVREFLLAQRHERETLYYGGVADCIVYVLNPVAKQADVELLDAFESRTRLPGRLAVQQHRCGPQMGVAGS